MNDMLIQLIQLGFHGLAFACLLLSFYLLRQLAKRKDVPHALATSVRLFMGCSIVLFVLGVVAQLYSGRMKQQITVYVLPTKFPDGVIAPELFDSNGHQIPLEREDGGYDLTVVDRDRVIVKAEKLAEFLARLLQENRINILAAQHQEEVGGG